MPAGSAADLRLKTVQWMGSNRQVMGGWHVEDRSIFKYRLNKPLFAEAPDSPKLQADFALHKPRNWKTDRWAFAPHLPQPDPLISINDSAKLCSTCHIWLGSLRKRLPIHLATLEKKDGILLLSSDGLNHTVTPKRSRLVPGSEIVGSFERLY